MKKITEWWVTPVDEHGESREVYYCDSKQQAIAERMNRTPDHPEAVEWILEKVTRNYRDDGNFEFEIVEERDWVS